MGGTALGLATSTGLKVFILLYADDLTVMAEDGRDLANMLKTLEKWTKKNKLDVNCDKTKIMIFRNGGKRKKENWKFRGDKIEVVREFKYLGFLFTTKNKFATHLKKLRGRIQQLVNKVWGETKRAGVTDLKRKLYFMDSTIKATAIYAVELWGWMRREIIEKVQAKYVKQCMGLARNTPDYIWKPEAGRRSLEVEAIRKAGNFILKIFILKQDSWPRKCLMEEVRAIKNGNPSNWGKEMEKALRELGDGQIINMLWERRPVEEVKERLGELWKIKRDQDIQKDWTKIEKSTYCEYYKEIKMNAEMELYLRKKKMKDNVKESWTRWRCENVLKENKKGWDNLNCRGCNRGPENLEHVIDCEAVKQGLEFESRIWWQNWKNESEKDQWRSRLIGELKKEI